MSAVTKHREMEGYSPGRFVDVANKVDGVDREQLEDITCRETPPELQALAALKLFNKFLDLRPREIIQSSWLTLSIAVPPRSCTGNRRDEGY